MLDLWVRRAAETAHLRRLLLAALSPDLAERLVSTMRSDRYADPRKLVSFDTETHRIQSGLLAPPLVCASIAALGTDGKLAGRLLDKTSARATFRKLLSKQDVVIVGANLAYDCLVMVVDAAHVGDAENLMRAIFDAYDDERMFDVQLAEALHGVALGTLGSDPRTGSPLMNRYRKDGGTWGEKQGWYSLDNVTKIRTGRASAKMNDEYRESYALLDGVPIAEWPAVARQYPIDDACNTLECALIQGGHLPAGPGGLSGPARNLHDLAAQVGSAWALHLGAAWGFNVDPAAIAELDVRTAAARDEGLPAFIAAGILRANGTQDQAATKRLIAKAYGCTADCPACSGTGKVPSAKSGKPVQCKACGATGLDISTAPVPTSPGSQCGTCAFCEAGDGKECASRIPGVSYGRDACSESGDELLINWAAFGEDAKIQSTYLPWLRKGIAPDGRLQPINLRPKALLETGRVSYGDVVQLLPRSGGVRETIVPRSGFVFGSVDYEGGELVTHAQSCLWIVGPGTRYNTPVRMAEALIRGVKVHDALGAAMAGVSYETMLARAEDFSQYRQAAKPANFGFPGGMGAVKLVLQQRKQGPDTVGPDGRKYKGLRFCILTGGARECGTSKVTAWGKVGYERPCPPTCRACIECAEQIRATWFKQWPENTAYFRYVADEVDSCGEVTQHLSRRVRGGLNFTSASNGYFQALLADIAKRALRRASRACYVRGSALYGSRIILFAHDEILAEHPEHLAADACTYLATIMVDEFKNACPDLAPACKAEPTLMRRWYKGAKPRYDGAGRLIPWEPK